MRLKKMKLPNVESYPSTIFLQDFEKISACNSVYFNPNFLVRYIFKMRLRKILEILSKTEVKSILDVGTGIGILLPSLTQLGESICAVDIHDFLGDVKKMCTAEGIDDTIFFNRSSCTYLPYKNESFNAIICISVLEHITQLEKSIKELYRILSSNGILIIGYPIGSLISNVGRRILNRNVKAFEKEGIILNKKNIQEREHHEVAFKKIRSIITTSYTPDKIIKIPFTWLSDFFSLYEIVVISK